MCTKAAIATPQVEMNCNQTSCRQLWVSKSLIVDIPMEEDRESGTGVFVARTMNTYLGKQVDNREWTNMLHLDRNFVPPCNKDSFYTYHTPYLAPRMPDNFFEMGNDATFSDADQEIYDDEPLKASTSQKKVMFTCTVPGCESLFNSMSNRKRHERLHSGEKPHKCEYLGCGKSFARKYDLKVHFRTHTKEKPYTCEVAGCGKKFSRNSSLREHERNIHNLSTSQKNKNKDRRSIPFPEIKCEDKMEDRRFSHELKHSEPLDYHARAQVRELVSLFHQAKSPDFKNSGEIELKSSLPKDLVIDLFDLKKERVHTPNLEFSKYDTPLPPIQNSAMFHLNFPPSNMINDDTWQELEAPLY